MNKYREHMGWSLGPENENKNRLSLPCGELLLSLISTGSFGKGSRLPFFYIVNTLLLFFNITVPRGRKAYVEKVKLPVHIKDSNNLPHRKFLWFLFPFSSKFPDLNFAPYRKIPKISPGAYIFQRPFLRGLYSEGLIYGGKFALQNQLG